MKLKSLGYTTDLFFPAFDGQIIDRGEYLVILSPENPEFYWGNFLLFSNPPIEGDFTRWQALFAREIGEPPAVNHQVFAWDAPQGDLGEAGQFLNQGFRLINDAVMVLDALIVPPDPAIAVNIRPLESEFDWAQALENQIECSSDEDDKSGFREFITIKMRRYRRMVEAGLGNWFGAFSGGRLSADCGVFQQDAIGRFQSVGTHPDFRRRGIAAKLVHEAGQWALNQFKLDRLVIVAEENSSAQRIYQSLGFTPVERQTGVEWWPDLA